MNKRFRASLPRRTVYWIYTVQNNIVLFLLLLSESHRSPFLIGIRIYLDLLSVLGSKSCVRFSLASTRRRFVVVLAGVVVVFDRYWMRIFTRFRRNMHYLINVNYTILHVCENFWMCMCVCVCSCFVCVFFFIFFLLSSHFSFILRAIRSYYSCDSYMCAMFRFFSLIVGVSLLNSRMFGTRLDALALHSFYVCCDFLAPDSMAHDFHFYISPPRSPPKSTNYSV